MISLSDLPSPPAKGQVTTSERNGLFVISNNIRGDTDLASSYPNVICKKSMATSSFDSDILIKNAFITGQNTFLDNWNTNGLTGVLTGIQQSEFSHQSIPLVNSVLQKIATLSLTAVSLTTALTFWSSPLHKLPTRCLIAKFAQALDWEDGSIRAFARHPHLLRFAVALHNDHIQVFNMGYNASSGDCWDQILASHDQRMVVDLSWKPFCNHELAVACASGVFLWNLEMQAKAARPSLSCGQLLQCSGHKPVTSVCWLNDGLHLASSSPLDSSIVLWNTATNDYVPLRRFGGVHLLAVSPRFDRLLAATVTGVFRVWETEKWTCERWSTGSGPIRTACWSADSKILIFATDTEPLIYALYFNSLHSVIMPGGETAIGGSQSAFPAIDLSRTEFPSLDGGEKMCVGGIVQTMVWDKSNKRLAILAKHSGNNLNNNNIANDGERDQCEFVIVFWSHRNSDETVTFIPGGYIRGLNGDSIQLIAFDTLFEQGSVLTVCYRSGQICHIPFYYEGQSSNQPNASQRHARFGDLTGSSHLNRSAFNSSGLNATARIFSDDVFSPSGDRRN